MKNNSLLLLFLLLFLISVRPQQAQTRSSSATAFVRNASLQELVNEAAHTALTKFTDKKLTEAQLSITLIDLRDPQHPVAANFRGNERVYPASVVTIKKTSGVTG